MAKALAATEKYEMQVVLSKRIYNLSEWEEHFLECKKTRLDVVDTYKHNKLSYAISLLEIWKVKRVVNIIKQYQPEILISHSLHPGTSD